MRKRKRRNQEEEVDPMAAFGRDVIFTSLMNDGFFRKTRCVTLPLKSGARCWDTSEIYGGIYIK